MRIDEWRYAKHSIPTRTTITWATVLVGGAQRVETFETDALIHVSDGVACWVNDDGTMIAVSGNFCVEEKRTP